MLVGSFKHSLDNKGRLVIPSQFRDDLSLKLYILRGFEGCLNVYSEDCFKRYLTHLEALPQDKKLTRDVKRIALSSVSELVIDAKHRVQLPIALLQKYQISTNLIVIGMIDHLEIWDVNSWDKYSEENEKEFENKFEQLVGEEDE